jgi:hypothetical protein
LATLQEKLNCETGMKLHLYKQEVFRTVYEQSALILCHHKPLKISVKYVKTVNPQFVSMGFSDATLAFFRDIFGLFVETNKHLGYFEIRDTDESINLAT